jgi:hypothetical protein
VLSFDTVHAVTTALLHIAYDTPPAGDLLGSLVLVCDHPTGHTTAYRRRIRLLQIPLLAGRHQHTLPAAMDRIGDILTTATHPTGGRHRAGDHETLATHCDGPLPAGGLRRLLAPVTGPRPGDRLLAFAVCYDDLAVDTRHLHAQRRVEAVDTDARLYEVSIHPDDRAAVVVVDDEPGPHDLPATYPPLARLARTRTVTASPPHGAGTCDLTVVER